MANNLDLSATLKLIDEISAPLNPIIKQSEALSKSMRRATDSVNAFERSMSHINNSDLNRASQSVGRTNSALQKARSLTKGLASDFGLVLKVMSAAHRKADTLSQSFAATRQRMRQQVLNSALTLGTTAMLVSIPIKASIDFESSMADVKKVVDFGDNPVAVAKGVKEMGDEIIRLSTAYPMAAKDIAAIIAAGGQSGIAKKDLLTFGQDAIKMGVAFDVAAQEAGQSMAEMRTAFDLTQTEVVALSDQINLLSNNTPAAARGIMNVVQRIGPLGEVGGYASGAIAALGATIHGMGVPTEVASTGIKNMMLALAAGESATKSQKAAFEDLGLDYSQIAKDMQTDAEGTTLKVLESISKLEKYKQAATLKDLFGSESIGAIAPLLNNLDALRGNLQLVSDETAYAGSMNAEYQARAATTANNIQLLINNLTALGLSLGNLVLPYLNEFIKSAIEISKRVKAWVDANPELVKMIGMLALKFIKINAAIWAVKYGAALMFGTFFSMAASFIKFGATMMILNAILAKFGITFWGKFKMMGQALLLFTKVFARSFLFLAKQSVPFLITALRSLSVALVTTPIGWIIMGIALAGLLLIKYWQPVKAFFGGMWTGFLAGIAPFLQSLGDLKALLQQTFAPLKPVLDFIIFSLQSLAAAFAWLITPAQTTQSQLNTAATAGQSFGHVLGVIVGLIGQVVAGLVGALALGLQTIGTAIGTFAAMVVVHGGAAVNYVAGIPGRMIAFLMGLPAQMVTIGGQIMDGLKNGIMSRANAVVEGIKGVAGRIKGAFTSLMGIHSPSRVFAGYGDFMMQGLNNGLLKNDSPVQAMIKTSDSLRAAMDTSEIRFDNRKPIMASGFMGHGNNQPQAVAPININIYAQPHQSEQQIAQLVAQEVAKAQRSQTNNTALYDLAEDW